MKTNPLVSIVVPVYNPGVYLEECVESILLQSYYNIEVVLIDDGSTDGSSLICDRLADVDKRIRAMHQENSGVSVTRNRGISLSKGEYVCFVDADDMIDKCYIEALVGCFEKADTQMSCTGITRDIRALEAGTVSPAEYISVQQYFEGIFYGDLSYGWGVSNKMFKLGFLQSLGIVFNESVKIGEDLRFITDITSATNEIAVIKEPLYKYRINADGAMHQNGSVAMYELIDSSEYAINSPAGKSTSIGAKSALLFRNAMYCAALTYSKRRDRQEGYDRCIGLLQSNRLRVIFSTRTSTNMKIKALLTIFGGISVISRLTR